MQMQSKVEVKQTQWHDEADLFILRNHHLEIELSDYGARLLRVRSPDKSGILEDVVLGFETLTDYFADSAYMGATIGRFANRIAGGSFQLGGKTYHLKLPAGAKHGLHGGAEGFDRRRWLAEVLSDGICMRLISPDGDMGFPGVLEVSVTYRLQDDSLRISYEAVSDATTLLNLTNHTYFNLRGDDRDDILSHKIQIFADSFTPIDEDAIPTGEIKNVTGTAFDLRHSVRIADRIATTDPQIRAGNGFNHNFVLNGEGLREVAKLYEPISGRTLTVVTSEPGLQFYTGNALNRTRGRQGRFYGPHSGLCLETQHFPDSPHHPNFPTTILAGGKHFSSTTIYLFGVKQ